MKVNKIWRIIAIVCLVLGIGAVIGRMYTSGRTESVEQTDISVGDRNQTLVYDNEKDIMYLGTQGGFLAAYTQDGEEVWKTPESIGGAVSDIKLNEAGDKMYVGAENNHFYVYQTADGTQLLDVDVQRKIVGIAVNKDESRIAVITNTGASKSNLLIYTAEGEQLQNTQYTTEVLRGIAYCSDGETLIAATKKGEIRQMSEDGEMIDTYKSGYEAKQMQYVNGVYYIVCRDGSYHGVTEDLKLVRKGKIVNNIGAVPVSIGIDADGEYILVGSDEGWIFVMDGNDQQVYLGDFDVKMSDTASADGRIYFAGYSDAIHVAYAENLANVGLFETLTTILNVVIGVLAAVLIVALVAGFNKSRKAAIKILKKVWRNKFTYLMLLPTFVLLFFFSYRGIFTGLTRAFTNWSVQNYYAAEIDFVGLDNFRAMLEEGYFLIGLKNLGLLLLTGILKTITMPLIAAWMLYSIKGDRRKYIHRFLFVLPIVVPGVVGSLVWQKIYDPSIGLLNQLLGAAGLESWQRVWLGDAKTAMGAILAMGFPYIGAMALLVYYGGFLNIGEDVIESAKIDGAGRWKIFWRIQLPLIKPQMSLLLILCFLGCMQDFNGIYIMTGGGPGTSTYVPALELYLNVAQFGRYGYASAMGVVLLIFTLTITVVGNLIQGKAKKKEA